jgi:hypothetical protein
MAYKKSEIIEEDELGDFKPENVATVFLWRTDIEDKNRFCKIYLKFFDGKNVFNKLINESCKSNDAGFSNLRLLSFFCNVSAVENFALNYKRVSIGNDRLPILNLPVKQSSQVTLTTATKPVSPLSDARESLYCQRNQRLELRLPE